MPMHPIGTALWVYS